MPVIKVYLHFVWSTKRRVPFLYSKEIRNRVWFHIIENARKQHIQVLDVSGYSDHCHCLISMTKDQQIWKLANLIKGESSNWINKIHLTAKYSENDAFDWQDGYYVESISPRELNNVKWYLKSQEEHHKNLPFEKEYESEA